jgi:hypothetical protein
VDAMLDCLVARAGGDRVELTRFTRAITGAYYGVPSAEDLAAFGLNDRT